MAEDLSITFSSEGCLINLDRPVRGFSSTVQAAMVNLVTNEASDAVFPDRGTSLLLDAVSGGAIVGNRATHIANVAAIETKNFMRIAAVDPTATDEILTIVLQPVSLQNRILHLNASMASVGGEIIPTTAQI